MKISLISRNERFSPNSVERDAAILHQVHLNLQDQGHGVRIMKETDLYIQELQEADMIFSMGRERETLRTLSMLESHIPVINSAKALSRLSRRRLLELCVENGIEVPQHSFSQALSFPFWCKRDDQCAEKESDVTLVRDQNTWNEIQQQGISQYVLEAHLEGDIIKFYGVAGTDFFTVTYPTFSKFGKEEENGEIKHIPFSKEALQKKANLLAHVSGIDIYGGDAVVNAEGIPHIIDFNDWPSFSSCREEAAKAIATLAKKHK